jgi:Mn-containing catalase
MSTFREEHEDPEHPWTEGTAPDGKGEFSYGFQPGTGDPDLDEVVAELYSEVN